MKITDQELSVGPMMKKISEQVERAVNENVKQYHLTLSQAKVILFLSAMDGKRATQKDIENFLQVSHPTTVTIVSSMASKGMISVKSDPDDRRMKVVELTWGDENAYEELRENAGSMEKKLLKGFTNKEKEEVYGYLRRICQNAAEMSEKVRMTGDAEVPDKVRTSGKAETSAPEEAEMSGEAEMPKGVEVR